MGIRCGLAILGLAALVVAAPPAQADQHVFVIASNADGYGVDRCLATGASCGTPVATAYCESHDYSRAVSFRRLDPASVTAGLPAGANACPDGQCDDLIAIECTR